ncbi:MAG: hypothetical protein COV29_00900 [Candidatus Yanofskybacteria bacterium CG10_big_fil_rev_8_21_14_0_10_36_16]|uniref:Uncharacterized protein n=1 Tax=Candidatus Yanofskybacteria bacterium CG10_big_fil_rev_8_21_14_0_10_36_16 TaxID=1975096 RepID=A0A2J0Q846_9BACT|nr:MAG: hypothetical protein COV29_00900 [Candidatus Yanofskybacteria bacterium CG10_big_fil_rev_8_21_14_0_10_36_16]
MVFLAFNLNNLKLNTKFSKKNKINIWQPGNTFKFVTQRLNENLDKDLQFSHVPRFILTVMAGIPIIFFGRIIGNIAKSIIRKKREKVDPLGELIRWLERDIKRKYWIACTDCADEFIDHALVTSGLFLNALIRHKGNVNLLGEQWFNKFNMFIKRIDDRIHDFLILERLEIEELILNPSRRTVPSIVLSQATDEFVQRAGRAYLRTVKTVLRHALSAFLFVAGGIVYAIEETVLMVVDAGEFVLSILGEGFVYSTSFVYKGIVKILDFINDLGHKSAQKTDIIATNIVYHAREFAKFEMEVFKDASFAVAKFVQDSIPPGFSNQTRDSYKILAKYDSLSAGYDSYILNEIKANVFKFKQSWQKKNKELYITKVLWLTRPSPVTVKPLYPPINNKEIENKNITEQIPEDINWLSSCEFIKDNKNYIAISVLANEFEYETDYLGYLARKDKVEGFKINKKWYANRDSVSNYKEIIQKKKTADALARVETARNDVRFKKYVWIDNLFASLTN